MGFPELLRTTRLRIRKTREKNGSGSDRLEKTILRTDPRKKPRIQNRTLPYFDIIKLVFYFFFRHKSQYIEILVMHYNFEKNSDGIRETM